MAGRAKVDMNSIMIAVQKPLDRACRQVATQLVKERVEEAKQDFLDKFLTDPITQEIDEGEHGEGGILPSPAKGNLFSFLGFEAGSHPIEELYDFLNESIQVNPNPTLDKAKGRYLFTVNIPSRDDIKGKTPMPWGTASSWVYAIEQGVGGLNYYLSIQKANAYDEATGRKRQREGFNEENSRSTTAIQSQRLVNTGLERFQSKYLSAMLNDLKRTLKS